MICFDPNVPFTDARASGGAMEKTMTKCLYVDDEPDICEIAELSLQLDPRMEVMTCSSGEEALSVADQFRPDIVLLDMMMPGMNGLDTLAALKAKPEFSDVPVVFVTARSHPQDVARCLDAGAVAVITKPFDPLSLADQTRRHIAAS